MVLLGLLYYSFTLFRKASEQYTDTLLVAAPD
jgi:hypothetical protein